LREKTADEVGTNSEDEKDALKNEDEAMQEEDVVAKTD